jgi:hypothetical protein
MIKMKKETLIPSYFLEVSIEITASFFMFTRVELILSQVTTEEPCNCVVPFPPSPIRYAMVVTCKNYVYHTPQNVFSFALNNHMHFIKLTGKNSHIYHC